MIRGIFKVTFIHPIITKHEHIGSVELGFEGNSRLLLEQLQKEGMVTVYTGNDFAVTPFHNILFIERIRDD